MLFLSRKEKVVRRKWKVARRKEEGSKEEVTRGKVTRRKKETGKFISAQGCWAKFTSLARLARLT